MSEEGGATTGQVGKTQILVAMIAAVGVIGAAWLSSRPSKQDNPPPTVSPPAIINTVSPVFHSTVNGSSAVATPKGASGSNISDRTRHCIALAMPVLPKDMIDGALDNPQSLWVSLVSLTQSGNIACARAMIEAGASPNVPVFSLGDKTADMTPLMAAIQSNSFELVKLLLDAGANPNLRVLSSGPDDPGVSTLSAAAAAGDDRIGKLLLDRGADVNAPVRDNRTGLVQAVLFGKTGLVRDLLARGAEKEIRERSSNNTPLEIAKQKGFLPIIDALTAH